MATSRVFDFGITTTDNPHITVDTTLLTLDNTAPVVFVATNNNITADLLYITIDDISITVDENSYGLVYGVKNFKTLYIPAIPVYNLKIPDIPSHLVKLQ